MFICSLQLCCILATVKGLKSMDTIEANIKITREKDKHVSVSVNMPIWNKRTEDGNLKVMIPFLGIDTIASNEADAESAVGEAICSFCIVSDKFGRGIEK